MRLMARRAKLIDQGEWSDFQVFGTDAILFYIKPGNNGAKYRFYDSSYNLITDLQPGDTPIYYKVFGEDRKTFDKYFVYNYFHLIAALWAPDGKSEITGANKSDVGTGKFNTSKVMAKSEYVEDTDTMWCKFKEIFLEESGGGHCGCSDWYIPSSEELRILMSATKRDGSYVVSARSRDIHSSKESTIIKCVDWLSSDGTMDDASKFQNSRVLVIRSF